MAMKPRRFSEGGSVVNLGAAGFQTPPSDADTTTGNPDSNMGPRIKEANKPKPIPKDGFDRTKGPERKPKPKKMRGGGMVKKKPVPKKMRGGGMVKKMRGGGMVKKK